MAGPLTRETLSPLVHVVQALQQTVHLCLDLAQLPLDGVQLFSSHYGKRSREDPTQSQEDMPSWAATSRASPSLEHSPPQNILLYETSSPLGILGEQEWIQGTASTPA